MKLLLDEMLSPRLAEQLRARGHDVMTVREVLSLRASDPAIFAAGQAQARAVVTRNIDDFRALAWGAIRAGANHGGLILVSDRTFPQGNPRTTGRLVSALLALLEGDTDIEGREYWLR